MKKCLFILMVLTIAFSSKSIAAVKIATITGAASFTWTSYPWVGGLPASTDDVVINFISAAGAGTFTFNTPVTVASISITNTTNTRATVVTSSPITVNGAFTIGRAVDVTLGTSLGNATCGLTCNGALTLTAANNVPPAISNGGGLYCNDNIVDGTGSLAMGNYSFLGIGSAAGFEGNISWGTGGNTMGNYIYNGIVDQTTGFSLPPTVNNLTIDNPGVVTIFVNQTVNGINLLKQGIFDITGTTITYNGLGKITVPSTGTVGYIKADVGTVDMRGSEFFINAFISQNLSSTWFVGNKIGTLVNANIKGISIAPAPALPLIIVNSLGYSTNPSSFPTPNDVNIGGSTIYTNDNVTLQSDGSGTANFGKVSSFDGSLVNFIEGKVSVERYLTGVKAWRLLSTPIKSLGSPSVKDSWQEGNNTSSTASPSTLISNGRGTRITGPAAYLGMNTVTLRGSMKRFNPTPTGVPDDFIFVTNTANPIAHDDGYFLFVRGDMGVGVPDAPNATVLRMKGNLRTGDITFNSANTTIGFQSIGNPYASRIEFSKITRVGIANAFHTWNPNLAGAYGVGDYENYVWISTDPNDPTQGYYQNAATPFDIKLFIESGQAIYVQHNVPGASAVTIHEADKAVGSSVVSRPSPTRITQPTIWIKMAKGDVDNTNPIPNTTVDANTTSFYTDGVFINFDNVYRLGINNDDVKKASKIKDNLAVKRDNSLLVADRRPSLQSLDTVYLNIAGMTVSNFRFEIDAIAMAAIYPGLDARLIDNYNNTVTPLRIDGTTQYIFKVNADAASKAANRFMIVFKNANAGFDISLGGRSAMANTTSTNQVQTVVSNNGIAISTPSAPGDIEGAFTEEKPASAKPLVTIYPNVITNGLVNVRLQNQQAGTYQLQVSNLLGQVIKAESIQVKTSNVLHTINIGNAAAGNYQILIVDKLGNKTTLGFIVL